MVSRRTPNYLAEADAQISLLVQVETLRGVENLKAIAETPGVDGVFIGPADLSATLGYRGQPTHSAVGLLGRPRTLSARHARWIAKNRKAANDRPQPRSSLAATARPLQFHPAADR
jgi:2-keto-3-deoxy-L-rhamnonate aldolase RhmA